MNIRLFRDATLPTGGGQPLPPSMSDLDTELIQPGDGTPKPSDLAVVAAQQDATPPVEPADTTPAVVDEVPPVEDQEEEVLEENYWDVVDKITGRTIKVDYPEGVDPVSPEGTALRIEAEREDAAKAFEHAIQKNDPRAYAYMLHRDRGGTDEAFFGPNKASGYILPDKGTLKDSNDTQTAVYKHLLMSQGNDSDEADVLIQKAIKDNKLLDKAEAAYSRIEKMQADELAEIQAITRKQEEEYQKAETNAISRVESSILNELDFNLPAEKRAEFQQFVLKNMTYSNGEFYVAQALPKDTLKSLISGLFFQFTGGNLSSFVKKEARTQAAQRLRLGVKKEQATSERSQQTKVDDSRYIPLGQL